MRDDEFLFGYAKTAHARWGRCHRSDTTPLQTAETGHTERSGASLSRRRDEEFLSSYAREYMPLRVEGLALVVIQAMLRAKTGRLGFIANKKRREKLGETVTERCVSEHYLKQEQERETETGYY